MPARIRVALWESSFPAKNGRHGSMCFAAMEKTGQSDWWKINVSPRGWDETWDNGVEGTATKVVMSHINEIRESTKERRRLNRGVLPLTPSIHSFMWQISMKTYYVPRSIQALKSQSTSNFIKIEDLRLVGNMT